ncbi:hypothetical protein V5O48_015054 [Marasmius crinis-equi]|uniref:Uncharacterized protein n=1 Tax=Marasmius crinis-equi TaxID=585013 RepID=A0ABR3EVL6_9AGAR
MYKYQPARGFDPKTPDFARHLGYPIYQVQSDSDRFEQDVDTVATASLALQSSPAVVVSPKPGDRSSNTYQPHTQPFPSHNALPIPFDDRIPYPGASATTPSTPLYSHTSPAGFRSSTYPNNYSGWNPSLPPSGYRVLPIPPVSSPEPPSSLTNPNIYEELLEWNTTGASSLK